MPLEIDDESGSRFEVGIQISDPAATHAFYGETLGLELYGETDRPNRHMWAYRFGTAVLKLVHDKGGARPGEERWDYEDRRIGMFMLSFRVTNGEEMTKACEKAGYEVVRPWELLPGDLATTRPGSHSLIRDPDGNFISLNEGEPWDRTEA